MLPLIFWFVMDTLSPDRVIVPPNSLSNSTSETQYKSYYWPPEDGKPRLRYLYLEILWGISRGLKPGLLTKLTGCSPGYVWRVRKRFSHKTEAEVLEIFRRISWI